jgi:hypothetical protein
MRLAMLQSLLVPLPEKEDNTCYALLFVVLLRRTVQQSTSRGGKKSKEGKVCHSVGIVSYAPIALEIAG